MKKTNQLNDAAFQLNGKMPLSQAIPLGLQHVLAMILFFKHGTTGFTSSSSILLGIICGYIVSFLMGLVLPTTAVNAEGVEYTKAWVLNWNKVSDAAWFEVPALLPIKPVFDMRAILPVMIMFLVTAVETVGDISGVVEGGLGSSFAALFGMLPNTSFSQNVGLVAMTKVVNRFALATGANANILAYAREAIKLIFGGSGIVPAAMVAILLPKEKN